MKLLVQPGEGLTPLVKAIDSAEKSVEIAIFRFDRSEIERALANAAKRGVSVSALIAYTNRGGEKKLRDLEMRLLSDGVMVARTANDLARYHNKLIIIDHIELYLLAFNFTYLDIEHSRSFGLITRDRKLVQEAIKLYEADTKRQPYVPGLSTFVVSPVNARKELAELLKGAQKTLCIYDPKISDPAMVQILLDRAKAGVDIRIIGKLTRGRGKLNARELRNMRLHTRCIVRDGDQAFIGSQSLRELELDERREAGIIFRDPVSVNRLLEVFEEDWRAVEQPLDQMEEKEPAEKVAKRVAKIISRELPPITPVLEVIVKEIEGAKAEVHLDPKAVEETVRQAIKEAVKTAVREVVEDAEGQADVPEPK